MSYRSPITESLIRSRSGSLIAVLTFATLATGLLQICVPLELRQLRASPNETGVTLAMFGFGMFAFEWVWGVVADRIGYRAPLVASQLLFGVFIVLLSRVESVPLIAIGYLLASGMMVAVGPIARSYLGTALHARLRARGLLTRDEMADRLKVSADTVKMWGRHGLLPRHRCNDKDECLYEPPGPNAPVKMQGRRLSDRRRPDVLSDQTHEVQYEA